MKRIEKGDRLRLLKFVCSFAWTDLKITPAEREVVRSLVERMEFDQDERIQVARWLNTPPPADEVDPTEIPREHRELFVGAVRTVLEADGVVPAEHEGFALFEELVG